MIVLDTNVVSELMRPSPAGEVVRWVRSRSAAELFTTSITLAEIGYGIARLPAGRRRDLLAATATDVFSSFADHVVDFDSLAATEYGSLVADRDAAGLPIDGFDAQIAAICRAHGAMLASRNGRDFRATGVDVVDPWNGP